MLQINKNKEAQVILIDYGMATRYLDDEGNHLQQDKVSQFHGNFMFASLSSLSFNRPSRRDDLISLCYCLIMLLNGG
jgi:hypothetical protein